MKIENFIGYPKNEVLKLLNEEKVEYDIVEFDENKFFDTQLLVKFEYINNKLILYFDKFKLEVQGDYENKQITLSYWLYN